MEDRYKVTIEITNSTKGNGNIVTIMSQKEIERFCERNGYGIKIGKELMSPANYNFGYYVIRHNNGFAMETENITLVKR